MTQAPPAPPISEERARRVRMVVLDVDGVLTDAGVYMGRDSTGADLEFKRFDIQDGLGVRMLQRAGILVAFLSGRVSHATTLRARELDVAECLQIAGAHKLPVMEDLMRRHGVEWDEVAMMGDDLPDLPVFVRVGLPVAVANAQPELLARAAWRTRAAGGRGAVREFCRALLVARGQWDEVVGQYVEERGGV